MRYFSVCVTLPLCRYVASVNQALEDPPENHLHVIGCLLVKY